MKTWDQRADYARLQSVHQGMIEGSQTLKRAWITCSNRSCSRRFRRTRKGLGIGWRQSLQSWVRQRRMKQKVVQASAAAESKALDAQNARTEVTNAAAAGAKAYQAVVGIPIVGPILLRLRLGGLRGRGGLRREYQLRGGRLGTCFLRRCLRYCIGTKWCYLRIWLTLCEV